MTFWTFCLIVLACSLVGNVSAAKALPKSEPEFRSAMMRRLHKDGAPDLVAMKKAHDARPQPMDTTYTSAGYVVNNLHGALGFNCNSHVEVAYGTPVNTCFVDEGFAYIFRLTQDSCDGAWIEYYFDRNCTQLAGTAALADQFPVFPYCALTGEWPAWPIWNVQVVCTSSSEPWVPFQSSLQMSSDGDSCAGSVGYKALATDWCNAGEDVGRDVDTMLTCQGDSIVVSEYESYTSCEDFLSKKTLPNTCQVGSPDEDVYSAKAFAAGALRGAAAVTNKLSGPVPSKLPATMPATTLAAATADNNQNDVFLHPPPSVSTTPFPTTPAELSPDQSYRVFCQNPTRHNAVFSVVQTLTGVSLADFQSDMNNYIYVLSMAVVASVTDAMFADNVSGMVVTDAATSAASALAASQPAVVVTYTVTISNTAYSTDTLAGELVTYANDGTFDEYLHYQARGWGATGLENANSTAIATTSLSDAVSSGGGSDSGLSAGAIAGIVVGAVLGLALIAGVVWYFVVSAKATSTAAASNSGGSAATPAPAGSEMMGMKSPMAAKSEL